MDEEKYDLADDSNMQSFSENMTTQAVTKRNLKCIQMNLVRPDSLVIISRKLSFILPKKILEIRIGRE